MFAVACLLLGALVAGGFVAVRRGPPPLTILYTSDTMGYLEPCGCGGNDTGGLARRACVIRRIATQLAHPPLIVDSGNIAPTLLVARVLYPAMGKMGYRDVTLARSDMWVGEELGELLSRAQITAHRLNVLRPESNAAVVREHGPWRVGILGVDEPSADEPLPAIASALRAALRRCRPRPDIVVVLSRLGLPRDRVLAQLVPEIDVIIGDRSAERLREPLRVGRALIAPTTSRGQHLLRLDITPTPRGPRYAFTRIALTREVPADPEVAAAVRRYFDQALAALERLGEGGKPPPYVRPGKCGECHLEQLRAWQQTGHARAARDLVLREKLAPECLRCHCEKFRRTGAPPSPSDFADGVQCSTCHGSGVAHSRTRSPEYILGRVPKSRCLGCHTPEHSAKFDYRAYLARIKHWGGAGEGQL